MSNSMYSVHIFQQLASCLLECCSMYSGRYWLAFHYSDNESNRLVLNISHYPLDSMMYNSNNTTERKIIDVLQTVLFMSVLYFVLCDMRRSLHEVVITFCAVCSWHSFTVLCSRVLLRFLWHYCNHVIFFIIFVVFHDPAISC